MTQERITPEGYDKEGEYFYRKNLELIEKTREKLDAERTAVRQRSQEKSFWMVCPKCGGKLREVNVKGLMTDHCDGCNGVFMDKGEIELLPHVRKVRGWLSDIGDLFKVDRPGQDDATVHGESQDIIDTARKKLDVERAAVATRNHRKPFWMVCPKCGGTLREVNVKGVMADHCGDCRGLFLDKEEVELIPHARQLEGWESAVRGLIKS